VQKEGRRSIGRPSSITNRKKITPCARRIHWCLPKRPPPSPEVFRWRLCGFAFAERLCSTSLSAYWCCFLRWCWWHRGWTFPVWNRRVPQRTLPPTLLPQLSRPVRLLVA